MQSLFFASNYKITVNIFWLVLAPLEHFIVNFTKYYPFKGARAGYVCMFWLESSPSHWVDAESDSLSTEPTQSETPRQLSQRGVRLHVNWVNAEDTNIYKDFIIPRWLSWRGVSLCVDWVDVEYHLALTQLTRNEIPRQLSHRGMLKNSNNSANSRTKSKTFKSLIICPICVRYVQKMRTKNLMQCTCKYYRIYVHSSDSLFNKKKRSSFNCILRFYGQWFLRCDQWFRVVVKILWCEPKKLNT